MKVSSSNPIIPGEELEGWSSWSPNALDGLTQKLTPVQLMELAQQRRRQREQEQGEAVVAPEAVAAEPEAADEPEAELEARAVSGYPTAAEWKPFIKKPGNPGMRSVRKPAAPRI